MTDTSDAPELEPEEEVTLPPPIDFVPVEGAQDLPDDVKNGDASEPVETYE